MSQEAHDKVLKEHLERCAYLYVRQSTLRQVIENTESTKRQYNLQQRAIALGWRKEQVVVIDCDLGESGASTTRDGFRKLVSEVGLGNVGIVMGLEVSRLARNSADWHRLLEICALSNTLILDEEGIYHPSHFNDRMLLGLKGTMSEAELHLIRARMQGGMLNKAKRGELKTRLPVGFVHNLKDQIVLDPEVRVRDSVNLVFQTYARIGTASGTVREFKRAGLKFPKRIYCGPQKGEIVFSTLTQSRVFQVLKNPRYAGAYVFGMRQQKFRGIDKLPAVKFVDRSQWKSFIKNAHTGYITWDQFEENLKCMADNASCTSKNRKCPPREGPALLQGLAFCGVCGKAMSVRYHARRGSSLSPDYWCKNAAQQTYCQSVPGHALDKIIADILLESISPASMEVALRVQEELQNRIHDADKLRFAHVERARYEMDLAKRRYLAVEPENRLVADTLESEWNSKIKDYRSSQEEYQRKSKAEREVITEESKAKIMALVTNFPLLWKNDSTDDRDRKRMVRLLISDVTLTKTDVLSVQIRFKGGQTEERTIPLAKTACEEMRHSKEVIDEIDKLLDDHNEGEVARILNEKGFKSGTGKSFDSRRVCVIRKAYSLQGYFNRLRKRGFLTPSELGRQFNLDRWAVAKWIRSGELESLKFADGTRSLYKPLIKNANNKKTKRGAV